MTRAARCGSPAGLLDNCAVSAHPWATGEIALGNLLGNLSRRDDVIGLLQRLPQAAGADDEVLMLIWRKVTYGAGIGYVGARLLAATRLTPDATLWTRDKRLSQPDSGWLHAPGRGRGH